MNWYKTASKINGLDVNFLTPEMVKDTYNEFDEYNTTKNPRLKAILSKKMIAVGMYYAHLLKNHKHAELIDSIVNVDEKHRHIPAMIANHLKYQSISAAAHVARQLEPLTKQADLKGYLKNRPKSKELTNFLGTFGFDADGNEINYDSGKSDEEKKREHDEWREQEYEHMPA